MRPRARSCILTIRTMFLSPHHPKKVGVLEEMAPKTPATRSRGGESPPPNTRSLGGPKFVISVSSGLGDFAKFQAIWLQHSCVSMCTKFGGTYNCVSYEFYVPFHQKNIFRVFSQTKSPPPTHSTRPREVGWKPPIREVPIKNLNVYTRTFTVMCALLVISCLLHYRSPC